MLLVAPETLSVRCGYSVGHAFALLIGVDDDVEGMPAHPGLHVQGGRQIPVQPRQRESPYGALQDCLCPCDARLPGTANLAACCV